MDINELIESLTEARERLGNQPVNVLIAPDWSAAEGDDQTITEVKAVPGRAVIGGFAKPHVVLRCYLQHG